jgi:hypothetical protein
MFLAGPPFNMSPELAANFIRAYSQALFDGAQFASGFVRQNQLAQQQFYAVQAAQAAQLAPPAFSPPPQHHVSGPSPTPQKELSEHEYLLIFQDQMLTGLKTMSEQDKIKMIEGVSGETLDGWALLSEAEKEILRAIFLPSASVEEAQEPLPSNESVAKVVAAMRNGTLNADTLAPKAAPKASVKDLTAAAAAPVQTSEGAIPQAPPGVVAAAAGNGSTVTSEQTASAPGAAAITAQESNPS